MTAPNIVEPYLTIATLVDRVNTHIRHLGGDGIDFATTALVRSLVARLVNADVDMAGDEIEYLCEAIGVGLNPPRPVDITEAERQAMQPASWSKDFGRRSRR